MVKSVPILDTNDVKGYRKVSFVLMTAVICLAALKYLQLFI
jgi:hypothetical protein